MLCTTPKWQFHGEELTQWLTSAEDRVTALPDAAKRRACETVREHGRKIRARGRELPGRGILSG
jgi:hypothetical protein